MGGCSICLLFLMFNFSWLKTCPLVSERVGNFLYSQGLRNQELIWQPRVVICFIRDVVQTCYVWVDNYRKVTERPPFNALRITVVRLFENSNLLKEI